MARCGFKTDIEYHDEKTGEDVQYVCDEPEENILDSGLCIFHDENYLKDSIKKEANEQNIKRRLSEKLAKSEPLICIGYHLPEFSFEELHFDKSADFTHAVFMGLTNFSKAIFKDANFSGAQFIDEANFSGAQFHGPSDYSKCEFINGVTFLHSKLIQEDRIFGYYFQFSVKL